jgi:glycosyltransferase involved in cell wall biosynthesis
MRLVRVAINAEQLLYRSPGGIGRYTAQLLTVLPEGFPDVEVVPFTAFHPAQQVRAAFEAARVAPARAAKVVILPWPRPILYEGWVRAGRPRLPKFAGVQLVHAPSVAVPPHPRVPLVVSVHDVAPALFPDAFPRRGRRFHHLGLAAAADRADLVITGSEAAAGEVVAHSSIPAERVRVVHHGVSPVHLDSSERRAVLQAHGLEGRHYVLWVGSLEPRKGVGTLVGALADLKRRKPGCDAQLVLAGFHGWLGDQLIADADRATLGGSLRQLGPVGERELWALYGGATVFAFPSRHEGFGLPVIEAMSQGVPVVTSDIDVLREVTGGAARLVRVGDMKGWAEALGDLLADPTARRALGDAGRARSRIFTVEATMAATRAVYREVAS